MIVSWVEVRKGCSMAVCGNLSGSLWGHHSAVQVSPLRANVAATASGFNVSFTICAMCIPIVNIKILYVLTRCGCGYFILKTYMTAPLYSVPLYTYESYLISEYILESLHGCGIQIN